MAKKRVQITAPSAPRRIEPEPVENLLLDPENPRFASGLEDKDQVELLRILWREFAVDEVAFSIAANGFFEEEPLFVIPKGSKSEDGPYTVVEGNRRLAAVLLLRDEGLRDKIKATNLPVINEQDKIKLEKLPVSKYEDRKELWRYLGFRHINGPQPWDPFSKAMYIAAVHDEQGVDLDEIANSIGDRHATVKRLYRGYKILEQAEKMTSFKREDRIASRFYFSHLYTAADQSEFQKFLGIDPDQSLRPNPVPRSKLNDLSELMVMFYGSKSARRLPLVQSQNPDLNILREVISDPKGVAALKAGLPLQRAHEISIGDERRFRNALVRAKEELQTVDGTLTTGYFGEEDGYLVLQDIVNIVGSIKDRMQTKRARHPRKPRGG